MLGGFGQGTSSVDKNPKKSTGTLNHWKYLVYCKEKCADHPLGSVLQYVSL